MDTKKILRALAHRADNPQPVYSSTYSVSDGFWHHTTANSPFSSDATVSATGHAVAVASTATDADNSSFPSSDYGDFHKKTTSATMSSGQIAAIAISSVFAVAAIAALLLYLCARRKRQRQQQKQIGTRGGSADEDEERLRPGTRSPVTVFPKIRQSSSGSLQVHTPTPTTIPDDPPTYEEIQHEYPYSQQSVLFASAATADGFRQYHFEPRPDEGNKLGP